MNHPSTLCPSQYYYLKPITEIITCSLSTSSFHSIQSIPYPITKSSQTLYYSLQSLSILDCSHNSILNNLLENNQINIKLFIKLLLEDDESKYHGDDNYLVYHLNGMQFEIQQYFTSSIEFILEIFEMNDPNISQMVMNHCKDIKLYCSALSCISSPMIERNESTLANLNDTHCSQNSLFVHHHSIHSSSNMTPSNPLIHSNDPFSTTTVVDSSFISPTINIDKYMKQRHKLFSKFDQGIKLDTTSWYEVTPESIAKYIAEKINSLGFKVSKDDDDSLHNNHHEWMNDPSIPQSIPQTIPQTSTTSMTLSNPQIITTPSTTPQIIVTPSTTTRPLNTKIIVIDAFTGCGGNMIQFLLQPNIDLVIGCDISDTKLEYCKHNIKVYGCNESKMKLIHGDYMEHVRKGTFSKIIQEYLIEEKNKLQNLIQEECEMIHHQVEYKVIAFLAPPYGTMNYLSNIYNLKTDLLINNNTHNGIDIYRYTRDYLTTSIIYLLPKNVNIYQVSYQMERSGSNRSGSNSSNSNSNSSNSSNSGNSGNNNTIINDHSTTTDQESSKYLDFEYIYMDDVYLKLIFMYTSEFIEQQVE